jgi:phosphohistidine phosphatase
MKLFVLRHAEAVERGDARYKNDAARPLTPKGIQRTKQMAHALRQMHVHLDAILSSPLVRARETAEIVAHGLRLSGRIQITPHLAPDGELNELFNEVNQLRPLPGNVMFVGHEPYLSELISLVCTGGGQLGLTLKKGGLCRLEVETLRPTRCATIEWLITSRWVAAKRARAHRHAGSE